MINNNSIVEYYNYDINLIRPIQFVCNLGYDISKIKDAAFDVKTLFNQKFLEEIQINFEVLPVDVKIPDTLSWIASEIATTYNREILNNIDLKKSQILLLHQPSKKMYVLNKKKRVLKKDEKRDDEDKKINTKNSLTKLIKDQKILKRIIDNIGDDEVRECILKAVAVEFDEFYNQCVTITDAIPLEVPYLKQEFLDNTIVSEEPIENTDVWVNKDRFKDAFQIEIGVNDNISSIALISDNSEVGILYNEYVFPIVPKFSSFIKEQSRNEFHWIQIKEVFKLNDSKSPTFSSELIEDFKAKFKNKKLTDLLSFLRENLYLQTSLLSGQNAFQKYFTTSLKISDIKYLKKFNFFISDVENPATLGIYTFDKIGEDATHFNLLHWYNRIDGIPSKYRDDSGPKKPNKNEVQTVSALLPELSFYFITKYFEDFVETILQDLQLESISNFHLYQGITSLGEFDFLVKNSKKFYFVEVKTTLTKFYIKDYLQKCKKIIDAFEDINIELEFLIIAAYSNPSVEDLRVYIDSSHKGNKRYNVVNPELDIIPYFFEIPIDGSSRKLKCIAEPNYYKLKKVIKKICQ